MNLGGLKKAIKTNLVLERVARRLVALVPYSLRKLDKEFWFFYQLLQEMEKWPPDKVREYQFNKLKSLVESAYLRSSFYREKFNKAGFEPSQLCEWGDFSKVPFLTKDEVRQFSKEMVLSGIDFNSLSVGSTSGTTGKALPLYFDKNTLSREWASICYQWKRVGYLPGDGRVELRGFIDRDVDYIYMPDERVLRVNIARMSESNISLIVTKIVSLGYKFIHGYPSAVLKFANILGGAKVHFKPQAIMMASEPLYDWQIEKIDEVFDCAKIVHYGMAEKVALAAWDGDRKYHFIPAYGIVEHDSLNHEIIGTGLINQVMPLIRYRVTDSIDGFEALPEKMEKSLFPVVDKIHGREEDVTFDVFGNSIPPALVTFPFKSLRLITGAKIIQIDKAQFIVIFESEFESTFEPLKTEISQVLGNLEKIYGSGSQYQVELTKKIPVSSSGKFRWIECRLHD
ncbi:hypothetical protein [Bdellovibrio sp. HCB288]|uniref:hypothetical protein n=1 Tax=Bdellovibrio sp. HCB288 TaxID=3394355 RepID=UPI0039B684CB